jgi:hypothetical protein
LKEKNEREEKRLVKERQRYDEAMARERVSLFGHFSHLQGKDTIFIMITSSYLELRDILRMSGLNRRFKSTHQTTNSRLIAKLIGSKITSDRVALRQLHILKGDLEGKIKRLEARDEVRSQILSDAKEDTMRSILEKYVVKPKVYAQS